MKKRTINYFDEQFELMLTGDVVTITKKIRLPDDNLVKLVLKDTLDLKSKQPAINIDAAILLFLIQSLESSVWITCPEPYLRNLEIYRN